MDATSYIARLNASYKFQRIGDDDLYPIDVTAVTGLNVVGTHNLITIPVGKVVRSAKVIIQTAAASAGAGTVKFSYGATDLTAALALANLGAGIVIDLPLGAAGTVAAYAAAAAFNINMTIGTADLTAFKFYLLLDVVDMNEVINNG